MMIFDYGGTLCRSSGFDSMRGITALYGHITRNPDNLTPEQINDFIEKLYLKLNCFREHGCEVPQINEMRLGYEYLGIEFDISLEEAEELYWNASADAEALPHAEELLSHLEKRGIRSAVISNINWSGVLLKKRLKRFLPNNRFEFVIATSDYVIRKPDSMLFELALKKAGLTADKVWYCGDNPDADIIGAHSAGIFPVYLDHGKSSDSLGFDFLRITDLSELTEIL